MEKGLERSDRRGLWLNLALVTALAVLVNGLIFALGWNRSSADDARSWFAPPDRVIAAVWVGLLGLLAVARWWLNASRAPDARRVKTCLTALVIVCLSWPGYSLAIPVALSVLPLMSWLQFAVLLITTQPRWF